jgi:OOP family OmpA-OmpF porin
MTGQTASREMRSALGEALAAEHDSLKIIDLTGIQAAQPPAGWGDEIRVASLAASSMANAYVVLEPGTVTIEGEVSDVEARDALQRQLLERAGPNVTLALNISIPAKVIAPFAFSAHKDAGGGIRLERCAARSIAEQSDLLGKITLLRVEHHTNPCPVGLGGPSGDWPGAVAAALDALTALPAGRIDIEYHNVRLIGAPPTSPRLFEDLKTAFLDTLPSGFEGTASVRDDDIATLTGISRERFWMHLSRDEEKIVLSGHVPSTTADTIVTTYAAALFGTDQVHANLVTTDSPAPPVWQTAAMRVLDGLAFADGGDAEMAGHKISFYATVPEPFAAHRLHEQLVAGLPDYEITTAIEINLPAGIAVLPLPGVPCAAALEDVIREDPIDFDKGSAVIASESGQVLDKLAATLHRCTGDVVEIGGHTDSDGSEDLNQRLSQARAEAVVTGLRRRGVPLDWLIARGYGEAEPIASNATEEGRARNRRIEFRAVPADELPAPEVEEDD